MLCGWTCDHAHVCVCVCVCMCVCYSSSVLIIECNYLSTGLKKKKCVSQWHITTRWKLCTNVHNREHWGTQKNAVEPRVLDQPSSSFVPLFVVGVERRIGKGLLCLWEGWRGELEGASFVCGRGGEEDRKGPPLFVAGVERRIGRGLLWPICLHP